MSKSIFVVDTYKNENKDLMAAEYMLAHPSDRFLYVAPYINKARRIRRKCGKAIDMTMRFKGMEYDSEIFESKDEYYGSYIELIEDDIKDGKNVAVPHYLLKYSTSKLTKWLRKNKYTLVIDNIYDLHSSANTVNGDFMILLDAGVLREVDSRIEYVEDNKIIKPAYKGVLTQFIAKAKEGAFLKSANGFEMWSITPEIIRTVKNTVAFVDMSYNFKFESFCEQNSLGFDKVNMEDLNM